MVITNWNNIKNRRNLYSISSFLFTYLYYQRPWVKIP
jgi:hypothetical protein